MQVANIWFKERLIIRLFIFLALFSTLHSEVKVNPTVTEKLMDIPIQDQKELADFFKAMLSMGNFAAVLFDLKPASLHDWPWWCVQYPEKNNSIRNRLALTYKGLNIWHKYASLFDLKYVFFEEGYHNGMFTLWFTKKNYVEFIKTYLEDSPIGLEKHRKLGTLLGFPENDVEGFCEERELELIMEYFPFDSTCSVGHSEPRDNVPALIKKYSHDFLEHLNNIEENFCFRDSCSRSEPFSPSGVYGYRSFDHKKADQSEWKQKVADLYNSDHFLEEIITLMVKDEVE